MGALVEDDVSEVESGGGGEGGSRRASWDMVRTLAFTVCFQGFQGPGQFSFCLSLYPHSAVCFSDPFVLLHTHVVTCL